MNDYKVKEIFIKKVEKDESLQQAKSNKNRQAQKDV